MQPVPDAARELVVPKPERLPRPDEADAKLEKVDVRGPDETEAGEPDNPDEITDVPPKPVEDKPPAPPEPETAELPATPVPVDDELPAPPKPDEERIEEDPVDAPERAVWLINVGTVPEDADPERTDERTLDEPAD